MELHTIAHIYNDYTGKFGIPRQSGLAEVESVIVFETAYRDPDALRGIDGYSHLWLLWQFSENTKTTAEQNVVIIRECTDMLGRIGRLQEVAERCKGGVDKIVQRNY